MEKFISLKEMSLIRLEHIPLTYDEDASAITSEPQMADFGDLKSRGVCRSNFSDWTSIHIRSIILQIINF